MAMRAALLAKKNAQAKNSNADYGQRLLSSEGGSSSGRASSGAGSSGVELKGSGRVSFAQYNPPGASGETDQPYQAMTDHGNRGGNIGSHQHQQVVKPIQEKYTWDVCIVVPNPYFEGNEEVFKNRKAEQETYETIMERLHIAGLQTYSFKSGDGDEIYIKIRASLERLQQHAEDIGMEMLMDPLYLRDRIDNKAARIRDDPDATSLTPYQFIYAKYQKERPDMFAKAHRLDHPFSSIIRIRLILDIIFSKADDCSALNLRALTKDGNGVGDPMSNSVIAYYPLHDYEARDELAAVWFNWRLKPWEQPLDEVKEYLGEKAALYFEFTAHYTTWLLYLSIASVFVILDMAIQTGTSGSFTSALLDSYLIPFYCIFVSFWSQLMIENWKRHEARKAMEWGMSNFESIEAERPEFKGEVTESIIDGKKIKFFDPRKKFALVFYSTCLIVLMMFGVIACVSVIFYLQFYFNSSKNESEKNNGNTFVSILSAVQIIILNYLYNDRAIDLTNLENHRTDTEYDDSLIGKLFAFSFVNSYASLFFIAFIKHNMGEKCQGPCMAELAYQLAVIFASKLTIDKVSNYFSLWLTKFLKEREEKQQNEKARVDDKDLSPAELEKRLEEYDPSLGVLQDYAQVFIQFGYVTLFVAACPIAPILAYLSNLIEMRSDGHKLLYMMRRTIPVGAQDIGTWLSILQMTAVASVITNAGILCFTMQILDTSLVGSIWIFIGFQYAIFIAMGIFAYVVDDVPREVQIQLDRQAYLAERAEMSDEDLGHSTGGTTKKVPKMTQFNIEDHMPHEKDSI